MKQYIPLQTTKTAGLLSVLRIAVGSRYETVANIDVQDGITNGSSSIVKKFKI